MFERKLPTREILALAYAASGDGARSQRAPWRSKGLGLLLAIVAMGIVPLVGCGGSGGASGPGGDEACGGQACGEGTTCNVERGRCECTLVPEDSCAPFEKICNSQKICIPEPPPGPSAQEWMRCTDPNVETEDGFVCVGPDADGFLSWYRRCETSDDCTNPRSVCVEDPTGSSRKLCWQNLCGDDAVQTDPSGAPILDADGQPTFLNGRNWGPCDTETGIMGEPSTAAGSCLPRLENERTTFYCLSSGELQLGAACRGGEARSSAAQCARGSYCEPNPSIVTPCRREGIWLCDVSQVCVNNSTCRPKECAGDTDCDEGSYCADGQCALFGTCADPCNAGNEGAEAGEFAGCIESTEVCNGGVPGNAAALEHALAYCQAGCDLFDPESCPGERSSCAPAPTPDDPLGGSCRELPPGALVAEAGQECDNTLIHCEAGTSCRTSDGKYFSCLSLCACEGEGGWDASGGCKTTATRCIGDEVCTSIQIGNNHLGVCLRSAETGERNRQ